MPETYFAPAGRRDPEALEREVNAVTQNPVIDAMKLFGEKALGGKITLETGTSGMTFCLELPV